MVCCSVDLLPLSQRSIHLCHLIRPMWVNSTLLWNTLKLLFWLTTIYFWDLARKISINLDIIYRIYLHPPFRSLDNDFPEEYLMSHNVKFPFQLFLIRIFHHLRGKTYYHSHESSILLTLRHEIQLIKYLLFDHSKFSGNKKRLQNVFQLFLSTKSHKNWLHCIIKCPWPL
jgi:hypothetical protein